MGDLSAHFDSSEFSCRDGSEHPINPNLINMLEWIRNFYRRPVTIMSGYRSPDYNAAVGGAKRSQHLLGNAADIVIAGIEPRSVAYVAARQFPHGGIGEYRTFVHIDCRPGKARWKGKGV